MTEVAKLLNFIANSPTALFAVNSMTETLAKAGFTEAFLEKPETISGSTKFFLRVKETGLFAFSFPEIIETGTRILFIGAHTDSPHLKLKPNAFKKGSGDSGQLYIEPYGGVLLHTWFDRELVLAGRVYFIENGKLSYKLFHSQKPVCYIPSLAIHLNRNANEELKFDKYADFNPIFSTLRTGQSLTEYLAAQTAIPESEILSYDLSLADANMPAIGGSDNSFIHSARLDNLAMCHAAIEAIAVSRPSQSIKAVMLYDNEEIGSETSNGAASAMTEHLLELILAAKGYDRAKMLSALSRSVLFSADMAHGQHPNFSAKSDEANRPLLNKGVVLKVNHNHRYATSGNAEAFFKEVCREAAVDMQYYTHRNDMPCGSTIGPILAAKLGITAFDAGNPMWSMHSIRETAGAFDHASMIRVMKTYFETNIQTTGN